MAQFLNNVNLVFPVQVPFGELNEQVRSSIRTVVRGILNDDSWNAISDDVIRISVLTGGLTNILYLVENAMEQKVIVRVFGLGTEMFIDRSIENILFAKLSTLKVGPTFYGLFENGRVEGFVNGRPLAPDELSIPDHYRKIASAVGQLHSQSIPEIGNEEYWLWNKIDMFFKLADDINFTNDQAKVFSEIHYQQRKEEFAYLKTYLHDLETKLVNSSDKSSRQQGILFGFTKPLVHNDLLSGNLLLTQNDVIGELPYVTIIDYEYGSYNYRAYDIGNHFNENCGYDLNLNKFPSEPQRKDFIRHYLTALKHYNEGPTALFGDEEFIDGFEEICMIFNLASHLFWGVWAIVQAGHSTVDFDYLEYAKLRFGGYNHFKHLLK